MKVFRALDRIALDRPERPYVEPGQLVREEELPEGAAGRLVELGFLAEVIELGAEPVVGIGELAAEPVETMEP